MKTISRMWSGMKSSVRKSLSACSEAGERLAWFFGITKPKYYAEIERYENMKKDVSIDIQICNIHFELL